MTEGDAGRPGRDADGIALGGVRTPPVDVPAEVLSGVPGPTPNAHLHPAAARRRPCPTERLAELYGSRGGLTRQQYAAAVDAAIEAGFVLEGDREAIESFARPELVEGG